MVLNEKPERFDQIIQSWDTANKDTELSNYSVCTTGASRVVSFSFNVYRRKLDFPNLKKAVRAGLHRSQGRLIEDKASGHVIDPRIALGHFRSSQAAPAIEVTRSRAW
jgi:phage terminase large subunit-like protein